MAELLRVEEIYSGYGGDPVIRGVSFKVREGEFVALIGPNGAGKSTLFKTLIGILQPIRGKIYLKGEGIDHLPLRERAREISFLLQFVNISFPYKVEDFILLGRFPYLDKFKPISEKDREKAKEVISFLNLEGIRGRKVTELSGGELQKVLIAQALVQEPQLLLLDEPTSHLDIGHQIEIMDLLSQLNSEGLTIMVVLHDLNLASEYCDRIMLLNEGRIVKDGKPPEVLNYKVIEEVYKTVVVVKENPYSKKPFVLLISGKIKGKRD